MLGKGAGCMRNVCAHAGTTSHCGRGRFGREASTTKRVLLRFARFQARNQKLSYMQLCGIASGDGFMSGMSRTRGYCTLCAGEPQFRAAMDACSCMPRYAATFFKICIGNIHDWYGCGAARGASCASMASSASREHRMRGGVRPMHPFKCATGIIFNDIILVQ